MKKVLLPVLMGLALVGCAKNEEKVICGEYEVIMTFSDDGETMNAVINGDELALNHAISASGARYVGVLNDTVVTLWGKGNDWTMFLNDEEPIFCETSK